MYNTWINITKTGEALRLTLVKGMINTFENLHSDLSGN